MNLPVGPAQPAQRPKRRAHGHPTGRLAPPDPNAGGADAGNADARGAAAAAGATEPERRHGGVGRAGDGAGLRTAARGVLPSELGL